MAEFELLVEQFEEPFCVCLFDRPPVCACEERADEALRVRTRMIADDFHGDILRSRSEPGAESASFGRCRRRSEDLDSHAARFAFFKAADRQVDRKSTRLNSSHMSIS